MCGGKTHRSCPPRPPGRPARSNTRRRWGGGRIKHEYTFIRHTKIKLNPCRLQPLQCTENLSELSKGLVSALRGAGGGGAGGWSSWGGRGRVARAGAGAGGWSSRGGRGRMASRAGRRKLDASTYLGAVGKLCWFEMSGEKPMKLTNL